MSGQPIVFVGPSLDPARAEMLAPGARIEPPAARGDLDRAVAERAGSVLLIDGVFAHRLAVSPAEIVHALACGVRVYGAASLGAIRAAECRPAGMEGIGAVAGLYRLGIISDDDEVAVAVEPERAHRASSVALINVRLAMLAALRARHLRRRQAAAVLAAAKATHFSQRDWHGMFAAARVPLTPALRTLCARADVKRRDAELALRRLPELATGDVRPRPRPAQRYRGHDPWLGHEPAVARRTLTRWLLGSGRYRIHLAAGESPELLWETLERGHELAAERMRWHALTRWAAESGDPPSPDRLAQARAGVARAHGHASWAALEQAGGPGPGIPIAWADDAVALLARARGGVRSAHLRAQPAPH